MFVHTTELRVRYAETDAMGIVYHGHYFTWFEVARVRLLDTLGLPYREMEQQGYHLPVIEAHAQYRQSARFDDLVHLTATIADLPRVRIRIAYTVHRDQTLLVTGHTEHAFVDRTGLPVKPPAFFSDTLRRLQAESPRPGGSVP